MNNNLAEFVTENDALLNVLSNSDTLYVASYLATQGFMQTRDFSLEFDLDTSEFELTLFELIDAGLIVYRNRNSAIFNGWVATERCFSVLKQLELWDERTHPLPHEIEDEIVASLEAHARHGTAPPTLSAVKAVLSRVPDDRQEWAAFAICFEPIGNDDLASLLAPSDRYAASLRRESIAELEHLFDAKSGHQKMSRIKTNNVSWAEIRY